MRSPWRRAARAFIYAAGGLALGVLGLVLALPLLVDQPRIRSALQERLSVLVRGTITWDKLQLRMLPSLYGVVEQPRVDIPGLLNARVGRLEARLRLWPLLRGHVEVISLTAVDAQFGLDLAPTSVAVPAAAAEQALDPVAAYRAAASTVARAVQQFAHDTQLAVERGSVDLRLAGLPPLALRALDVRAQSAGSRVELRLATASEHWKRLVLEADFDSTQLSGRASLEVEDLNPHAWIERVLRSTGVDLTIAPLDVRAALQTGGANALSARVEARTRSIVITQSARVFDVPGVAVKATLHSDAQRARIHLEELLADGDKLLAGDLEYAYASRDALGRFAFDLEAARTLGMARRVLAKGEAAGLPEVKSAAGRLRGSVHVAHKTGHWRAGLQLQDADASFQLRQLPWPVLLRAGSAEWQPGLLSASAVRGGLGRSSVTDFAARLHLEKALRMQSASGKASLDLDQLYPWLREQPALANALRDVPALTGILDVELVKASGRLSSPDYEVRIVPRRVRIQADALPGPLSVDGGVAQITPSAARIRRLALSMLDVKAILSASAAGIGSKDFRVQGVLGEGSAGPEAIRWALTQAKAPSQLALRAPLAFAVERLDWGPGRQFESSARIVFDPQTHVEAELAWQPGMLDLKRLMVQDSNGTGTLALRAKGRQLESRFHGEMHGAVLAYFLKDAERFTGRVAGDLRFNVDLDRLRQASVVGHLSGEGVDFTWLAKRPLLLEKFAIDAEHAAVRIGEVVVRSGKQAATLRGELRRGEGGPIMQVTLESEGILLDELLALGEASDAPPANPSAKPAAEPDLKQLWPLPVTGRVALRAGYVQHGHYRVAPVVLDVTLEADRARLNVEQARLCGIDLPFVMEARSEAWSVSAHIAAPPQPVAEMVRCLTSERVQITGNADIAIALKTQGRGRDLVRNLEGGGKVEVRDGRLQRFALIGNILSLLSITDIPEAAREGVAGEGGFRFKRIAGAGRFRDGQFVLEEGVFDSPSARMVANGTIKVPDGDARITVLVAPLGRVDRMVRGIPVIGYVIGGALTSIPVGVSGDIRNPIVVPLGPRAVSEELLGIFERTLKLPTKLVEPAVKQ